MLIDENIIDNSNTKRSVFLNKVIKLEPNTNLEKLAEILPLELDSGGEVLTTNCLNYNKENIFYNNELVIIFKSSA